MNHPSNATETELAARYLIDEIEAYRNRGPARDYLHQIASQYNYSNPQMDTYVISVIELANYYADLRIVDPQSALPAAAASLCRYISSSLALSSPEIMSMFNQQQRNTVHETVAEYGEVGAQIKRWLYNQRAPQTRGYQQPQPRAYGQPAQQSRSSVLDAFHGSPDASAYRGNGGRVAQTRSLGDPFSGAPISEARAKAYKEDQRRRDYPDIEDSSPFNLNESERRRQPQMTKPVAPEPEPYKPAKGVTAVRDRYKNPEPLNDHGDANTVDYQDHKTFHLFQSQSPLDKEDVNTERADHAFVEAARVSLMETQIADKKEEYGLAVSDNEGNAVDVSVMGSTITHDEAVCSIGDDPWYIATLMLDEEAKLLDSGYSYNFIIAEYNEEHIQGDKVDKLKPLGKALGWGELVNCFNNVRGSIIRESQWTTLNRRVTHQINEFMVMQLNMPKARIDSFACDIPDMRDIISRKYSSDELNAFDDFYKTVQETTLKLFTSENSDYMQGYTVEAGKPCATFAMKRNVVLIPCWGKDILFTYSGQCGTVLESQSPLLYDAIKKTFDKQKSQFAETVMLTRDGHAVHIYQSVFDPEVFYLSRGLGK